MAVGFLLLAGCEFEAPLVAEDRLEIEEEVLGVWMPVPKGERKDGKVADKNKRMIVLEFSDTEYLVQQGLGDGFFTYRAYPIELGGVRCVQLEAIGTDDGPIDSKGEMTAPFQVVSHEFKGGELVVRTLNKRLFPKGLKTTEALQKAFLEQKDKENLFANPEVYRKVE